MSMTKTANKSVFLKYRSGREVSLSAVLINAHYSSEQELRFMRFVQ
jgi:hypothetical protein